MEQVPAIERILCPVDFSESSVRAYRYAQSLAWRLRAELVVQHIVELWQHPCAYYAASAQLFEEFQNKLMADARRNLEQFINLSGGAQPECLVQEGLATDAILSLARERSVGLIVMGTHGRRGFDRLTLGSVAERVLRHAACPVLAVRETADDSAPIRRILCCVDFSANAERALEYALSLARAYDAEVTVLHVLDDISSSAAASERLEKLIPPASRGATKIHLEVRLERAYRETLQFAAEEHSDVIVTGVQGRHALDLAVFGSATHRVIQLGAAPVLAVPLSA